MDYLKSRNAELNPRYQGIATDYMRLGEKLGLRWDYAFYQMILETGTLSYRRGNRSGDVKPAQNNFAGLGATGGGEPGDSFPDIASGVHAHLQHLLLYAGEKIDNPIAERTRKVQEWGVLKSWQERFTRPITYSDLGAKWAPGSGSYVKMLEGLAERFHENFCDKPDPRPELVAEARGGKSKVADAKTAGSKVAEAKPERPTGTDLARRAMSEAQQGEPRFALGALDTSKAAAIPYKLLNPPAPETDKAVAEVPPATPEAKPKTFAAVTGSLPKLPTDKPAARNASAAAGAKPLLDAAPPAKGQKCRVWTASYGGMKAMIIRSVADKMVNFTVLDVNEGAEAREAEAFIAAYAKDGKIAGEFPSQAQALDKAFELCPEG